MKIKLSNAHLLAIKSTSKIACSRSCYLSTKSHQKDLTTYAAIPLMHDGQLSISVQHAQDTIYNQFPEFIGQEIKLLVPNVGTVNAIYRIGTIASARFVFQRQHESTHFLHLLHREQAAMTEFLDNSCFPGPQPIGIGQSSATYPLPWTVQSWLEGNIVTAESLAASNTFALDIARLITSLREVDVKERKFDGCGRGGNLRDHDAWMERCFGESLSLLDVPRLRKFCSFLRDLPKSERMDIMSHRDLTPMNILVEENHIVGILDTASFGPADPALDLVAVWHMLDRERRDLVREAVGVRDIEWVRGAAWAFEQAMGWAWYYQRSNPIMTASGKVTLQRIMEDAELMLSQKATDTCAVI